MCQEQNLQASSFVAQRYENMEKTLLKVLLIVGASGAVAKYVYYQDLLNWFGAQERCRQRHTDLAPVSVPRDQQRLSNLVDYQQTFGWIGLYRDPDNVTAGWRWSGGTYMTFQNWGYMYPASSSRHCAHMRTHNKRWYEYNCYHYQPFFCFNVVVVTEEKTWEEALEHCRERHGDLASLLSETEVLLVLKEVRKKTAMQSGLWTKDQLSIGTEEQRLWIGLRYLGDRWLWVNEDPMENYQAWSPEEGGRGGRASCPGRDRLCGVLTMEGRWESRDCGERHRFICY